MLIISIQVDHSISVQTEMTAVDSSCGLMMMIQVALHHHHLFNLHLQDRQITPTGIIQVHDHSFKINMLCNLKLFYNFLSKESFLPLILKIKTIKNSLLR